MGQQFTGEKRTRMSICKCGKKISPRATKRPLKEKQNTIGEPTEKIGLDRSNKERKSAKKYGAKSRIKIQVRLARHQDGVAIKKGGEGGGGSAF